MTQRPWERRPHPLKFLLRKYLSWKQGCSNIFKRRNYHKNIVLRIWFNWLQFAIFINISALEVNIHLQMSFSVYFFNVAACYSFYRKTYCTDHTYSYFVYEISHVLKVSSCSKKNFTNFALIFFCMFSVFMTDKGLLILEGFPYSWQSKLLPQNFTCSFLLLKFLNNRPHWSQGSIFIPSLALELYSYKKQ